MRSRPSDRIGFLLAPNAVPGTVLLSSTFSYFDQTEQFRISSSRFLRMFIAEGIMPTLYQAAPTSSICGPHIVSGLSELRFCFRQLDGRSRLPGEDTYSCLLGRTSD